MPIKKPAAKTTSRAQQGSRGEVVLYKSPDGGAALQVRIDKETVWLTQRQMAELFGKDTDTVGPHIRNAYKEGELEETATTEDSSVVQRESGRSVRRTVRHYNLDVIIEPRSNCAGALQYVPELTWLLFLRILDERETREAEEAEAVSAEFTPSLEAPYRWQDWAAPGGAKRTELDG